MTELELLAVAGVSFAGSFVKSITGMGYPMLAIPVLSLVVGVEAAVVLIAVPNVVLNAVLGIGTRSERSHTRDLPVLLATMTLGAVAGALVLVEAPEEPLLIALALSVLAFVVLRLRDPDLVLEPATTRRWSPLVGILAGLGQGAIGVSGPVVAAWLHGYRLPRDAYVFAVTLLFLAGGAAQLVVLLVAGLFTPERWLAAGVALVGALLALPTGVRLRSRLPGETFERLILALLVVSGASLLVRAWG